MKNMQEIFQDSEQWFSSKTIQLCYATSVLFLLNISKLYKGSYIFVQEKLFNPLFLASSLI